MADLAYIAAIVDTQGHITTRTVRETVLPALAVSSPNTALLTWLGQLTGTRPTITRRQYGRAACSEHCPDAHQHVTSVSGRWSVTGAKATVVLHSVTPYLRLRTEEAAEAVRLGTAARFKPATVAKMLALGWSSPPLLDDVKLST